MTEETALQYLLVGKHTVRSNSSAHFKVSCRLHFLARVLNKAGLLMLEHSIAACQYHSKQLGCDNFKQLKQVRLHMPCKCSYYRKDWDVCFMSSSSWAAAAETRSMQQLLLLLRPKYRIPLLVPRLFLPNQNFSTLRLKGWWNLQGWIQILRNARVKNELSEWWCSADCWFCMLRLNCCTKV